MYTHHIAPIFWNDYLENSPSFGVCDAKTDHKLLRVDAASLLKRLEVTLWITALNKPWDATADPFTWVGDGS